MNNLQLSRMYQRFRNKRATAGWRYRPDDHESYVNWIKWDSLSIRTAVELEKRLAPRQQNYTIDVQLPICTIYSAGNIPVD